MTAETCEWAEHEPDWNTWRTQCGNLYAITEGTPTENKMAFCCYCGKPIRETRIAPMGDTEA